MLTAQRIYVFDVETLHSADDLPTGWKNKAALGLSIGCWYSYVDEGIYWFDRPSLEATMQQWVEDQPLLVGFNSIAFDATLMRALLRQEAEEGALDRGISLNKLCDDFKTLAARSYDILAEIWRAAPDDKYVRELNSLDAILAANGLPPKTGHGAQAPRDWQAGKIATVLNYCQDDVLRTKALFELICTNGGVVQRRSGPLQIRRHLDI